jgi:hypothetical protein
MDQTKPLQLKLYHSQMMSSALALALVFLTMMIWHSNGEVEYLL